MLGTTLRAVTCTRNQPPILRSSNPASKWNRYGNCCCVPGVSLKINAGLSYFVRAASLWIQIRVPPPHIIQVPPGSTSFSSVSSSASSPMGFALITHTHAGRAVRCEIHNDPSSRTTHAARAHASKYLLTVYTAHTKTTKTPKTILNRHFRHTHTHLSCPNAIIALTLARPHGRRPGEGWSTNDAPGPEGSDQFRGHGMCRVTLYSMHTNHTGM